ncbi:MAG: peptidoglycan-binding protein, partial [bacterium]|nr:peptidoglycan-binding protein [bacterium]
AVTGYQVFRAGVLIASPTTNSYSDTGLTASTLYSYTVKAVDGANNVSGAAAASATTLAAADTTPPSTPTGLTATTISSSQINLAWTASTDNVAVTGYQVFRAGVLIASPTTNSYSNTGLTAATAYSYTVKAKDAAGNVSTASGAASATTLAASGTTFRVGPDQPTYKTPMALWSSGKLTNGATVLIDACTYTDDYSWSESDVRISANNVYITSVQSSSPNCVVPTGMPNNVVMALIKQSPPSSDVNALSHWGVAKGLWNITGSGITIDHVAFTGAYNAPSDTNGAGLRLESAGLTTITNDYFFHNQNGILGITAGAQIVIQNSEFYDNGTGGCVNNCTHQVYLGGDSVSISNSYFHDYNVQNLNNSDGYGHHIKSRAKSTTITNTRVYDNNTSTSFDIDMPQGGIETITNNVIQKGTNPDNTIIVNTGANGADGAMNPAGPITISNNTFINDYTGGTVLYRFGATTAATGSGNSFYGPGAFTRGLSGIASPTILTTRPTLDTSSPVGPNLAFAGPSSHIAGAATAPIVHTLAVGWTGPEVSTLQSILTKVGFFSHHITGYFGAITEVAVKGFQAANNLAAVGIVGPKTRALLMQDAQ